MRKIPSLFQRNYETDRLVRDEVVPGCEWVLAGEGVPTVKIDGTCCAVLDGVFYKRYELKNGRPVPAGFTAAQVADPVTGDVPGWVPVSSANPSDVYHMEALNNWLEEHESLPEGTCELVGPKVQKNPYKLERHILIVHAEAKRITASLGSFEEIKNYLNEQSIEGIVWHHPDGRMAKIKRRDFGFPWPL